MKSFFVNHGVSKNVFLLWYSRVMTKLLGKRKEGPRYLPVGTLEWERGPWQIIPGPWTTLFGTVNSIGARWMLTLEAESVKE